MLLLNPVHNPIMGGRRITINIHTVKNALRTKSAQRGSDLHISHVEILSFFILRIPHNNTTPNIHGIEKQINSKNSLHTVGKSMIMKDTTKIVMPDLRHLMILETPKNANADMRSPGINPFPYTSLKDHPSSLYNPYDQTTLGI